MKQKTKNDVLSLEKFSGAKINSLIKQASAIKKSPQKHSKKLAGKTLLSIFEKPSLRTRISFEVGMCQLGGNAMTFDSQVMPMGKKETIEDTAKVVSRYVDIVMARMYSQEELEKLAQNATIPVINGLTDKYHPCQILSDLLTIKEHKNSLKGLKLSFFGDGNNNVTHCLLLGCALCGIDVFVACPKQHSPQKDVLALANEFALQSSSKVVVTKSPLEAASGADVVYTDSWMSYHIKAEDEAKRLKEFSPFQVTGKTMALANKDAVFMNCLPAKRGYEQTAQVIDSAQSIVFDQAENRLHMQKAILLHSVGLL